MTEITERFNHLFCQRVELPLFVSHWNQTLVLFLEGLGKNCIHCRNIQRVTVPEGRGAQQPQQVCLQEKRAWGTLRLATPSNTNTPSFHVKTQLRDTCATKSCDTAHDVNNERSQVWKTELVSAWRVPNNLSVRQIWLTSMTWINATATFITIRFGVEGEVEATELFYTWSWFCYIPATSIERIHSETTCKTDNFYRRQSPSHNKIHH